MSSSLAGLLAASSLLFATACQKHQDPIGSVPADDVPAVPTGAQAQGAAATAGAGGASACKREIGAEREACLRRYPPTQVSPVEPEKTSQPPAN